MAQDTITLKANSEQRVRVKGRFFTVISCTAGFKVGLDDGDRRDVQQGSQLGGPEFSKIVFRETSGADNVITYDAGDVQIQVTDVRSSQVENIVTTKPESLYLLGTTGTIVGANNTVDISSDVQDPPPTGPRTHWDDYTRIKIKVHNLGGANKIMILGKNGVQCGQTITSGNDSDWIDTDQQITLQAINGNVTYGLSQICRFNAHYVV